MAANLSLVVLRSVDIDATRRFYEAIGLSWQEEHLAGGPKHHSARVGELLFELYPTHDDANRRVRLVFCVKDTQQVAESAVTAGGRRLISARQGEAVVVEDPDGNPIELLPASAAAVTGPAAVLSYEPVRDFVRHYTSRVEDPPPSDVNGVIHLLLAALDNLCEHWIDADLDQVALSVTAKQREHLIKIGKFLQDHDETRDAEAG